MNRTDFLNTSWLRYPQAESGWSDVEAYQRGHGTVVCGRIERLEGSSPDGPWRLSSNGASLEFVFNSETRWMRSQNDVEFQVSYLAKNDLCAVVLKSLDGVLQAETCLLLAPALRPISRPHFSVQRSQDWALFLKTVREFFEARGFIEAATPTLVASPGTEPFLDPFETEWVFGSARHKFFLPTSPEFHLKKMLSFGWTRVFELKTCFRNGELSPSHQAEFLMLEWYRAYATLDAIADDVGALLDFLLMRLNPSHGIQKLTRTTMADLFAKAFSGFELRSTTSIDELRELAKSQAVHFDPTDSWDDVFLRIFIEKIEDKLGAEGPLLVRGYPPSQAALSRIAHNGFADRFEVYWRGLELANAFHELNDPIENQVRFKKDAELKAQLGKAAVPGDLKLLEAFESGMPPAGGIALGVERLFMALFEIQDISETRAFPLSSM